jgi:hypothetical protein
MLKVTCIKVKFIGLEWLMALGGQQNNFKTSEWYLVKEICLERLQMVTQPSPTASTFSQGLSDYYFLLCSRSKIWALSWVATAVFNVRLLHAVAFSKQLPWFEPTNVGSLKTQPHAVNACVKRSSQRSLIVRIRERLSNSSMGIYCLIDNSKCSKFFFFQFQRYFYRLLVFRFWCFLWLLNIRYIIFEFLTSIKDFDGLFLILI